MMLKKLWREKQFAVCILVFELQLIFWFDVDLRVQMNHMIKQLTFIATFSYFIAAADDEYL